LNCLAPATKSIEQHTQTGADAHQHQQQAQPVMVGFCFLEPNTFTTTNKMNCKDPEDRQDESIVVRVSIDDKLHIRNEAKRQRVSMSTVVRQALMNERVIPRHSPRF